MQRTVLLLVLAIVLVPCLAGAQAKPKPKPPKPPAVKEAAKPPSKPDPVRAVLDTGELARAYNPVLLNYLLEEGRPRLPKEQHRLAVDQLVTRFKQELDIRPGEQVAASAVALGGLLFGGAVGSGLRSGAADVWGDWVDSGLLLARAGYKEDVVPFFENCIENYPFDSMREKCTRGLAMVDSERAFEVLMRLEKKDANQEVKGAALRLLGYQAGLPDCPKVRHDQIVDTLIERTQGFMNVVFSVAAIDGLTQARDPRAIEPLRKMTKGYSRTEAVARAAKRALLIGYKDETLVPVLEKDMKGGFGKEDDDKFFAAALLIEGGYDSGFAWAREQLTKKKGGLLKIKKGNTELLDEIVWVLVNRGDKARSIPVLQAALPVRKPTEWLSAYIAVGLLDLGDATGMEIARQALQNKKWLSTRLEAAEGLAAHGDLSGVPVLKELTEDRSFLKQMGDAALSQYHNPDDLRIAVAGSLADMDRPEGVDLLLELLANKSDEVRTAAAYALGRMQNPRAIEGLSRGLGVDYGKQGARERSPVVRAHLLRMAVLHFGQHQETRAMLARAAEQEYLSVKFLALVASRG